MTQGDSAQLRQSLIDGFVEIFTFALDNYPEQVTVAPLVAMITDWARQNDKRPGWVKVNVSDEVVQNIKGNPDLRDFMAVVRIPRVVMDRMKSKVIIPGESRG